MIDSQVSRGTDTRLCRAPRTEQWKVCHSMFAYNFPDGFRYASHYLEQTWESSGED